MYKTVQKCQACGAGLTLDDMRQTDCPYCKTVYPHHSMAAQHAEVVGQVLQNMTSPQAPTGAPPGMAPPPFGTTPGGAPSPYGAAPPSATQNAWGAGENLVNQHFQHAHDVTKRAVRNSLIISVIILLGVGVAIALAVGFL